MQQKTSATQADPFYLSGLFTSSRVGLKACPAKRVLLVREIGKTDAEDIIIVYAPKKNFKIKNGTYEAQCIEIKKGQYYDWRKIYFKFQIIQGEHTGVELWMHCNLYGKVTRASKYYEVWVIANKGMRPKPNDRMSPKLLRDKIFKVRVETVTRDGKQRKLPDDEQYSIIRGILELCVG